MEEGEEEQWDDDIIAEYGAFNDTVMGEAEEEVGAEDEPTDDLGQAICDAQRECESEKGEDQVRAHARGSQENAIPNLWCGAEKVGYHTGIVQWKAKNGVSNKGFGELLKIQKKMLPKDNKLPATTYEAK